MLLRAPIAIQINWGVNSKYYAGRKSMQGQEFIAQYLVSESAPTKVHQLGNSTNVLNSVLCAAHWLRSFLLMLPSILLHKW